MKQCSSPRLLFTNHCSLFALRIAFLIFFTIHSSLFTLKAQSNLDSLWSVWQDEKQADTTRLKAFDEYVKDGYLYNQPDSAFYFAQLAYDYSKKKGLTKQMADALNVQGITFWLRSDYPRALDYFTKTLSIREEIGDKRGIGLVLSNIGLIQAEQGNYILAIEYLEKGLAQSEEIGDKNGEAIALNNMGTIFVDQGNYPRALSYYQKGLKIREKMGDRKSCSSFLVNIGIVHNKLGNVDRALEYYQKSLSIDEEFGDIQGVGSDLASIGNVYSRQGKYRMALENFEKSLKVFDSIGNKGVIAQLFEAIGINYSEQLDYRKAMEYYQKSLLIREEIGDKLGVSGSLINLGKVYNELGNESQALDYCKRGKVWAEEIGALDAQREACKCLYEVYKGMGKGDEALVYLEKVRVAEDSLQAEQTAKKLEQMEFAKVMLQDSIAKAEDARLVEEAHNAEVRREKNTRNWLIAGGLVTLLLAGGFYSRWRFVQKSKAALQTEKDRSDHLLLNILPEEIARELKEKGRADARDFDMVSILFTDFKGFTEQSAMMSAAELVQEINHCFEAFDKIMEEFGIEKIKTIGDAYMAAGGLPIPSEDSVRRTVLAALRMQAFILGRAKERSAEGLPFFEMRLGIHTGPVVAGIVGVKKFQYDIWGDTVNTASRMESAGQVGKVNISESTYAMIKDDPEFVFEHRGRIEAKGKGEMEMWFVGRA